MSCLSCVFFPPGQWRVSPQRGWSWGLPSSGLKAPFPPPAHPSALPGTPSTRLACLPHLQVYKKTEKKKDFNDKKKTVISYHSHHQRTKILPVLKENKRQKKRRKKDLLLHWSFVFRNMKAGMFSYFLLFFRDYAYFIDFCFLFLFFVLLEIMHFCN